MVGILVVIILVLALIWGLASISQSYAAAKQAEAAIEASRATQIASAGNLVTILLIALLVIALLAALGFIAWLYYRLKIKPLFDPAQGDRLGRPKVAPVSAHDLLPTMMAMMLYQMMQQQSRPTDPHRLLPQRDSAPVEPLDDIWTL